MSIEITEDGLIPIGQGKSIDVLSIQEAGSYDLGGGTLALYAWENLTGDNDKENIANYALLSDVDLSTAPNLERLVGGRSLALNLSGSTSPNIRIFASAVFWYSIGSC